MDETIEKTDKQPAAEPAAAPQQRPQIQIDDSKACALYSNFCRVTGTPEELIIDFGLNPLLWRVRERRGGQFSIAAGRGVVNTRGCRN